VWSGRVVAPAAGAARPAVAANMARGGIHGALLGLLLLGGVAGDVITLNGCLKSPRALPNSMALDDDLRYTVDESTVFLPAHATISSAEAQGFDLDILDYIARYNWEASGFAQSWVFNLTIFDDSNAALYAVRNGQCDFLPGMFNYASREICRSDAPALDDPFCPAASADRTSKFDGGVSGTNICCIDFTKGYLVQGNTLIFHDREPIVHDLWETIFQDNIFVHVLNGLFSLGLLVIFGGHVAWLLERGVNPEFPMNYSDGVDEGLWWAVATVTTVGYGDRTAVTVGGRAFAVAYMIASVLLMSFFTSILTAELSAPPTEAGTLSSLSDYEGKKVCTKGGSYQAYTETNELVIHVKGDDFYDCLDRFMAGEVDAIVHNWGEAIHWIKTDARAPGYAIKNLEFNEFAIALPEDSPHVNEFNSAILALLEDADTYNFYLERWFESLDIYDKFYDQSVVHTLVMDESKTTVRIRWEWGWPFLASIVVIGIINFVEYYWFKGTRLGNIVGRLQRHYVKNGMDPNEVSNKVGFSINSLKNLNKGVKGWMNRSMTFSDAAAKADSNNSAVAVVPLSSEGSELGRASGDRSSPLKVMRIDHRTMAGGGHALLDKFQAMQAELAVLVKQIEETEGANNKAPEPAF